MENFILCVVTVILITSVNSTVVGGNMNNSCTKFIGPLGYIPPENLRCFRGEARKTSIILFFTTVKTLTSKLSQDLHYQVQFCYSVAS